MSSKWPHFIQAPMWWNHFIPLYAIVTWMPHLLADSAKGWEIFVNFLEEVAKKARLHNEIYLVPVVSRVIKKYVTQSKR